MGGRTLVFGVASVGIALTLGCNERVISDDAGDAQTEGDGDGDGDGDKLDAGGDGGINCAPPSYPVCSPLLRPALCEQSEQQDCYCELDLPPPNICDFEQQLWCCSYDPVDDCRCHEDAPLGPEDCLGEFVCAVDGDPPTGCWCE